LEGNKTVTPGMNTLSQEQQNILRQEKENFMSPMELKMQRMSNYYGGRITRRKRNNSRTYKNKK